MYLVAHLLVSPRLQTVSGGECVVRGFELLDLRLERVDVVRGLLHGLLQVDDLGFDLRELDQDLSLVLGQRRERGVVSRQLLRHLSDFFVVL